MVWFPDVRNSIQLSIFKQTFRTLAFIVLLWFLTFPSIFAAFRHIVLLYIFTSICWRNESISGNIILWNIWILVESATVHIYIDPLLLCIFHCCSVVHQMCNEMFHWIFQSICWQQQELLPPPTSRRHFCAPITHVIEYGYISVQYFCWHSQKLHLCIFCFMLIHFGSVRLKLLT